MTKQLKTFGGLAAASVLALALAGCAHRGPEVPEAFLGPDQTAQERNPINVVKARTTLTLDVPARAGSLNIYQKERVRHFIADWRDQGSGKLAVSGNNKLALADLRDLLIERRVPVTAVGVEPYGKNELGIKLSFARLVAQGPKCGNWDSNLASDISNREYRNFGCADQHNLAALISNPRDLQVPRDQTDWSDGDRADFVFRHFWIGVPTGAEIADVKKAGNISEVAAH